MKAAIFQTYGGPNAVEYAEVDKPVPGDSDVLVRVRASSLNAGDWYEVVGVWLMRPGQGWTKPKNTKLGSDYAGVVEAVGSAVTDFKPGDEVYGARGGAFAEYVAVPQDRGIVPKPANVSFEEAATVPVAGLTALQYVRDHGQVQPGQHVLIHGAGGGVGTFTVQIAKIFGAEVTAVTNTGSVDLVRSLGADRVIDYTREDFTRGQEKYDLFVDIGGGRSWRDVSRVLKPDACVAIVGGRMGNRRTGPIVPVMTLQFAARRAGHKTAFTIAKLDKADLLVLKEMIESGKLKPAIDRIYPLSETAQALQHMEDGPVRGKIVIKVD